MTNQGSVELVEQPQERKFDGAKGWSTTRRWHGSAGAVNSKAALLIAEYGARISLQVAPDVAGNATLSASFDSVQDNEKPEVKATGEPVEDSAQFTLAGNDLEKSIFSCPRMVAMEATYPADYTWLRTNLPIVKKNGTWKTVHDSLGGGEADGDLRLFFKLFMTGAENFSVSQFVLKISRTFSSSSTGQVRIGDAGKQFTTAQLISVEDVPENLIFALPTGSWLKRTPTVSYDGKKLSVEVEYWHADGWSPLLYPQLGAAEAGVNPATVTTGVYELESSVITMHGEVTADGGDAVTERGFIWALAPIVPTIDSNRSPVGAGLGAFTFGQGVSGLPEATILYRAYAINSSGNWFGVVRTAYT